MEGGGGEVRKNRRGEREETRKNKGKEGEKGPRRGEKPTLGMSRGERTPMAAEGGPKKSSLAELIVPPPHIPVGMIADFVQVFFRGFGNSIKNSEKFENTQKVLKKHLKNY